MSETARPIPARQAAEINSLFFIPSGYFNNLAPIIANIVTPINFQNNLAMIIEFPTGELSSKPSIITG